MGYIDTQLFIDGKWAQPAEGKSLPVVNPSTGKEIGRVAHAGRPDLDRALAAAKKGFEVWRDMVPAERSKIMRKAAALMRERAGEIAPLLTQEQGKPLAEARVETLAAGDIIDWFAEEGFRVYGRIVPSRLNVSIRQMVIKDPVGPVAAFTPWNFPINQVVRKIGAGLAAATILVDGDDSRWFHLKGFGEAIVTTSFLTASAKRIFGRHRPDYDGGDAAEYDGQKSFPSGHASQSAAAITYLALYLHAHVFDGWREPGETPWWEVTSYATLGALALAVPAERVLHKRHHLSDVVAGSLLGAAVSTGFFLWQEHRYEKRRAVDDVLQPGDLARTELPAPTLGDVATPTFSISGTF